MRLPKIRFPLTEVELNFVGQRQGNLNRTVTKSSDNEYYTVIIFLTKAVMEIKRKVRRKTKMNYTCFKNLLIMNHGSGS